MSEIRGIISEVSVLAENLLGEYGMEMVDTEFKFEHGRWVLRLYIDKYGGVTLDDCADISRELGDLIDARNVIDYSYVLEVSSPGLDRPLTKEKDFIRSIGKIVTLNMIKPVNNRRNFNGRIVDFKGGIISLLVEDDTLVELPLKEINKARLKYEL